MRRIRATRLYAGWRSARSLGVGFMFLLFFAATLRGQNQSGVADEYDIRAAMLVNIPRFVSWPASKVDPAHPRILLCIVGSDPVKPSLDHLLQQEAGEAHILRVKHLNSFEGASGCDMVYAGHGEQHELREAAPGLLKAGVLVITERPNNNNPDQIIGLPTAEEHVRIEVNLTAAQRAGLTISSKLLRLATVTR